MSTFETDIWTLGLDKTKTHAKNGGGAATGAGSAVAPTVSTAAAAAVSPSAAASTATLASAPTSTSNGGLSGGGMSGAITGGTGPVVSTSTSKAISGGAVDELSDVATVMPTTHAAHANTQSIHAAHFNHTVQFAQPSQQQQLLTTTLMQPPTPTQPPAATTPTLIQSQSQLHSLPQTPASTAAPVSDSNIAVIMSPPRRFGSATSAASSDDNNYINLSNNNVPKDRESLFDFSLRRRSSSAVPHENNINNTNNVISNAAEKGRVSPSASSINTPNTASHSILYRIFHPENAGNGPQSLFAKSKKNFSGSESEFDSDASDYSDISASSVDYVSKPTSAAQVPQQTQPQSLLLTSKATPRSSVPRIASHKELASLFDSRKSRTSKDADGSKNKLNFLADSESESEAESSSSNRSAYRRKTTSTLTGRPSIFKGLLDKASSSQQQQHQQQQQQQQQTGTPSPQQPQQKVQPQRKFSTASEMTTNTIDSEDTSDSDFNGTHHQSSSTNIFKNIMMGGKRRVTINGRTSKSNLSLAKTPPASASAVSIATAQPQTQSAALPSMSSSLPHLSSIVSTTSTSAASLNSLGAVGVGHGPQAFDRANSDSSM
ncbi:hypothetical protein HK100_002948, partial [Physocladia obscura]